MTGKVKLVSAGGGSVSLATPSTGSNRTVTLPDADLTIPATNSSSTLTTQGDILYRDGSGIQRLAKPGSDKFLKNTSGGTPSWADAGGGKVGQIVQYTDNANRDLGTTGSWTQVPSMEKAITTTDNSSKVLVQHMGVMWQDAADLTAGVTVYRDSTNLGSTEYGFNVFYGNNNDVAWNVFIHYLDTPGTAGSYTYKIYYKTDKSDGHYNQWTGRITTSVITLTEILP